jgi:hypothetical protein
LVNSFGGGGERKTGTFDIILFFSKKIFLNKKFTTKNKRKRKKIWLGPW